MSKLTSRKMLLGNNRKLKQEKQELRKQIKIMEFEKSIKIAGFRERLIFAFRLIFKLW